VKLDAVVFASRTHSLEAREFLHFEKLAPKEVVSHSRRNRGGAMPPKVPAKIAHVGFLQKIDATIEDEI
jgi:hypothetical protein